MVLVDLVDRLPLVRFFSGFYLSSVLVIYDRYASVDLLLSCMGCIIYLCELGLN